MFESEKIAKAWMIRKQTAKSLDCKVSLVSWKICLEMATEENSVTCRFNGVKQIVVEQGDKIIAIVDQKGNQCYAGIGAVYFAVPSEVLKQCEEGRKEYVRVANARQRYENLQNENELSHNIR